MKCPEVKVIGRTTTILVGGWYPQWNPSQASPAAHLIEMAGRTCYRSFDNPSGRTTQEYIDNILKQGHFSVLEHPTISLAIRGISRSCSHEIVRHRHFSFSQLSQRYVDESDTEFVLPPAVEGQPTGAYMQADLDRVRRAYATLVAEIGELAPAGLSKTDKRKWARQAARAVLPNCTATEMVMTGNLRAWCHFLKLRASEHADAEIRRLAIEIWKQIKPICPEVFTHFWQEETAAGTVLRSDVDWE